MEKSGHEVDPVYGSILSAYKREGDDNCILCGASWKHLRAGKQLHPPFNGSREQLYEYYCEKCKRTLLVLFYNDNPVWASERNPRRKTPCTDEPLITAIGGKNYILTLDTRSSQIVPVSEEVRDLLWITPEKLQRMKDNAMLRRDRIDRMFFPGKAVSTDCKFEVHYCRRCLQILNSDNITFYPDSSEITTYHKCTCHERGPIRGISPGYSSEMRVFSGKALYKLDKPGRDA